MTDTSDTLEDAPGDTAVAPNVLQLAHLDEPRGLRRNNPGNLPGYILFDPMISDTTYLIDRSGRVVHVWRSDYAPASVYLLEDGTLWAAYLGA